MKPDKFKNYFIGRNSLFFPEHEFVIKLSFPRVFVKYKVAEGYYSDFEKFFTNVADVQYLEGIRPSDHEQQKILNEIWNFITMEKSPSQEDFFSGESDI